MSFRALVIAACLILPVTLNAEHVPTLSAAVEEVLAGDEDGYRAIAYVVRWHGSRVLVEDPLAKSRLSVGASLNFMASHHDVAGQRLLSFVFSGPPCKCDHKSGKPAATQGGDSAAKSVVGLVEEVLSAEEDGYRFVAYVVQAPGLRIAVSDPLARSHRVVGEKISFLTIRNDVTGNRTMAFLAFPPSDSPTEAQRRTAQTKSEQSGVIEEILSTNVDGFGYTAYILDALGARVVVQDAPGAMSHRVGDQFSFVSQRIASPNSTGPGILRLETSAPEEDKQEDVNLSMTRETATVAEVLTTQSDGYRYVAYIVKWHGARIAVSDALSNTSYAVGDPISFPASRATSPGGRQLSFLLFNFTKPVVAEHEQGSERR